jgi:hypothetical protein
MDCYLLYFRQQLITRPLLALLSFQALFTESSHKDQLHPPILRCAYSTLPLLLCVSFQFLVYCSVFVLFCFVCSQGISLPRGAMLI